MAGFDKACNLLLELRVCSLGAKCSKEEDVMDRSKSTIRVFNLVLIMSLSLIIGVGCAPTPTPSQPTEAQPTLTPTKIIPTPTMQPTSTPLPPTDEPGGKEITVVVPPGSEAIIDGVLKPEEWESALRVDLVGGEQLFMMHEGGYLYLGIRAKPEPVTSICVDQSDRVSILHSSAALGTSIYQQGATNWEQIKDFEWCCRDTTDSPQAQEARQKHLLQYEWVASNGRMGNPDEVEYQIAMPDDSLRLAVTSIGAPNYSSVISWPEDLVDDCSSLDMIGGPIPEQAQFSVEEWITLTISPE